MKKLTDVHPAILKSVGLPTLLQLSGNRLKQTKAMLMLGNASVKNLPDVGFSARAKKVNKGICRRKGCISSVF